jgi:ATP-binding cassette subfamily B protein
MFFNKFLNKYLKKYAIFYIIGVGALIFVDYIQLEMPQLIADFFSDAKNGDLSQPKINKLIGTILVLAMLIAISRIVWRLCIVGSSRRIEKHLKDDMYDHCQQLSQAYYSHQKVGAMMSIYISDIQTISFTTGIGVVMMVDAVVMTIFTLLRMMTVDVQIALIVSAPMIISAVIGIFFGSSITKSYEKRQDAQEDLSDFVQENFSGIAVVRAFSKEKAQTAAFNVQNDKVYDASMGFIKKIAILETVIESVIYFTIFLIVGVGSYLVFKNITDPAIIVQMYLYFGYLVWPMIALTQLIDNISQGRASMKRVYELMCVKPDVVDSPDSISLNDVKCSIEFNHLNFAYPDDQKPVLEDVSFRINQGELVGIIGNTGSGKSTIVELLLRTYNLPPNTLKIDNTDIMKVKIANLRNFIGYVPQNNFLFSETVENNIAFGISDDSVHELEVKTAAELADIDHSIEEFPLKYKTVVGERGTTLSGGQKQRISIARALIKDPKILILDDSVSAVDTATEAKIINNLKKIRKNKTTIIIGHRISTMQSLDKVILLNHGKVMGIGSHVELAKASSLYAQMIIDQQLQD